jgi:hypothetical protein
MGGLLSRGRWGFEPAGNGKREVHYPTGGGARVHEIHVRNNATYHVYVVIEQATCYQKVLNKGSLLHITSRPLRNFHIGGDRIRTRQTRWTVGRCVRGSAGPALGECGTPQGRMGPASLPPFATNRRPRRAAPPRTAPSPQQHSTYSCHDPDGMPLTMAPCHRSGGGGASFIRLQHRRGLGTWGGVITQL